jgi:hypothetical protein
MNVVLAPIKIVTPSKRYPAAESCIYCGRKGIERTAEHIVPFGLAANSLVIGKASCKRCQRNTHAFETHCLRQMWWPFRTAIGAPSRGKEKPEAFSLRTAKVTKIDMQDFPNVEVEDPSVIPLSPRDYPLYYMTHRFPPPGVLIGRDPDEMVSYEAWVAYDPDEFRKHIPKDKDGIDLGPGQPEPFLRLLAKMAHGFAVAELGQPSFDPVLREFIRDMPLRAANWIGGDLENPPREPALHRIGIHFEQVGTVRYVVVTIRLFCFLGTPQYHVVVGSLKGEPDERLLAKQTVHAIEIEQAVPLAEFVPLTNTIGPGRG